MNFLRYFPKIFLVVSTLSFSACEFNKKDVISTKIFVTPEQALIDEPVEITIANLAPKAMINIEASCKNKDNDIWKSFATFQADDKGVVHIAKQAPISGTYKGVDPMGLFWSMMPSDKEILKKVPSTFNFNEVLLSVIVDNKVQAQKTIHRLSVAPNVEKRAVNEQGLVGTLFYPKNIQHAPGIIVVGGSGGRIPEGLAQLFASHGYVAFALGYFGVEGLPARLKNIPLEYFQHAMQWFKKQPQVDSNHIAICGNSRGGELVLLLAATFPQEMQAVIAYTPSGIAAAGSWTYKNESIPGIKQPSDEQEREAAQQGLIVAHKGTFEDPEESTSQIMWAFLKKATPEEIAAATIPVENIRCPVLFISGQDDRVWGSTLFSNMVMERLDKKKSTITRKHLQFPAAGHSVQNPYWPSASFPCFHPRAKVWSTLGGTMEGNARANEQAWAGVLDFLKDNLAKPASISAWQRSVNEIFAAKKSGSFEAKDKKGVPVIFEWQKTIVHEPEYVRIMRDLADLVVRAFVQVDVRELKAHPEVIGLVGKDHPYKQLEPLFKNGVESVDWKLVEEKLCSSLRLDWQSQTEGEVALKLANFIVIFVEAKDPVTKKLLGFVRYLIDADAPNGAVELEPLAVASEEEKRGLGRLLVSSIFRIIPGVNYIWLGTSKTNDVAIGAYQSWGFVKRETDPRDLSVPMEYRAEKSDVLQKTARTLTER